MRKAHSSRVGVRRALFEESPHPGLRFARPTLPTRGRDKKEFGQLHRISAATNGSIVGPQSLMLLSGMVPDRQILPAARVILDDRSRLPWRFFGRLTTAALSA